MRSVGRYEIERPIGRGGMATVYLARQTDLDRDVALKELNLVDDSDPRAARRFLREARLAGGLSHPNIVTVHDFFQYDGKPYIAMEYLPHGSLRPYVGQMSLAQIGGVVDGILGGLAYAEGHHVVHRDLKPENVMVTSEGRVKIADFGIAKATTAVANPSLNITATGATLGTPNYIAPEQAMAKELGPGTDLYALGVMVWELLVGRLPFWDTDEPIAIAMRHVNEEIPPVSSAVPGTDEGLSAWVGRLLVKDPRLRADSAAAASDELDEILIDLLGPRWRRDALLAPVPDAGAGWPSLADDLPLVNASRALDTLPPTTRGLPRGRSTYGVRTPPTAAVAGGLAGARVGGGAGAGARRARNTVVAVLAIIAIVALLTGLMSGGDAPPAQQGSPASNPAGSASGDGRQDGGSAPSSDVDTTPSSDGPDSSDDGVATQAPSDQAEDEMSDDPSDEEGGAAEP